MNGRAVRIAARMALRHPRVARRLGAAALRHPRRTADVVRTLRRGSAGVATLRRAAADPELRTHVGRMTVAAVSAARRVRAVGVEALAEDDRIAGDLDRAGAELSEALASPGAQPVKAPGRTRRRAAVAGLAVAGIGAYAGIRASRTSRRASDPAPEHGETPAPVPRP